MAQIAVRHQVLGFMLLRWVNMEDGDTEKYHPSRMIQDFVFLSRKGGCTRCISLQVYNKDPDQTPPKMCRLIRFSTVIKKFLLKF